MQHACRSVGMNLEEAGRIVMMLEGVVVDAQQVHLLVYLLVRFAG